MKILICWLKIIYLYVFRTISENLLVSSLHFRHISDTKFMPRTVMGSTGAKRKFRSEISLVGKCQIRLQPDDITRVISEGHNVAYKCALRHGCKVSARWPDANDALIAQITQTRQNHEVNAYVRRESVAKLIFHERTCLSRTAIARWLHGIANPVLSHSRLSSDLSFSRRYANAIHMHIIAD